MSLRPSDQKATHRFFDHQFNCESIKVLPGEYFISAENVLIMTVLGSCVSACIRDRLNGIGGMNHFMLPEGGDGDDVASYSMRYGACAMEVLINELLKAGASRKNLEAKVFGGANVIAGTRMINVGERNARFVHKFLALENIPIASEDLNKTWGRKVLFFPTTGKALVKKVIMHSTDSTLRQETEYARSLKHKPTSGDIDLF